MPGVTSVARDRIPALLVPLVCRRWFAYALGGVDGLDAEQLPKRLVIQDDARGRSSGDLTPECAVPVRVSRLGQCSGMSPELVVENNTRLRAGVTWPPTPGRSGSWPPRGRDRAHPRLLGDAAKLGGLEGSLRAAATAS